MKKDFLLGGSKGKRMRYLRVSKKQDWTELYADEYEWMNDDDIL